MTEDIDEHTSNKPVIGNLIFAIIKAGDQLGHPALGTNYLHRKTAATLSSDAYLDFARDYYSGLLKNFGVSLSKSKMSVEEWFEPVAYTAHAAGFSWTIVTRKGEKLLGETDSVSVPCILEELRDKNAICTIYEGEGIKIKSYTLSNHLANARQIIEVSLLSSQITILIGVERPGFSDEMAFNSPWRNFLVDFARIAEAALTRITYGLELQRKQVEAASYQGLASAAVTIGTVIHQLSNLAHGHLASVSSLLDAFATGELTASEEIQSLMHSMKRSSKRMIKFLSSITNVTKTDERRPSPLLDAVHQAGVLFEASLLQRKISLDINVAKDLLLDVPFSVVTLAIANLIGNAKDAMPEGGKIRIEAKSNGDIVLCRVTDEGRGIPDDFRDKIFDLGFSTKNGEGSGWGLYLTRRSLLENRSSIALTETTEKGSTFTIQFPKARQEL